MASPGNWRKLWVRSVHRRRSNILADRHGLKKVIACGLEKNDYETLNFLFGWAEVVLVVGSDTLWSMVPTDFRYKAVHLNIGPDRWGHYGNDELVRILTPLIDNLVTS